MACFWFYLARQIRKIHHYSVGLTYSRISCISCCYFGPHPRVLLFKAKLIKLSMLLPKIALPLPEIWIPSLLNRLQSSRNILFSGQQMGASIPLTSASPTASIYHFLLWHPLPVAHTVSPCRPCSWVSMAVKASYLFLVAMLEGEK